MSALTIQTADKSPEQKQFNKLLESIETSGKAISDLTRLRDSYRSERASKITPLIEQARQWDIKLVLFLNDRLSTGKGLSIKQQDNIAIATLNLGHRLMLSGEVSTEIQSIINKLSELYAVDEVDTANDADHEFTDSFSDAPEEHESKQTHRTKSKKNAKVLAQEKQDADAQSTLRQIYRKLASALHPDREPDEAKKDQKTALMSQVNAAHDKKDLLAMLKLQLQIEQIDPESIARMADDKMYSYNRVLNQQLKALQLEQAHLTDMIRHEFGLFYGSVNEKALTKAVRHDVHTMKIQVEHRKAEFNYVQHDKHLKAWAKEQMAMMDDEFGF